MLKIVIIMLSGILVGRVLHRHRLSVIPRVITVLRWMLLFLLGIEVGSNERIINGLIEIGGEALLLTCGGMMGSVLLAWMLWRFINRKGQRHER